MAMRMRLLLSMALILATAAHARAQSAAELFDDAAVHEVRLRINSRDLALLRERFMLNTYYAADFTWQGTRVRGSNSGLYCSRSSPRYVPRNSLTQ